MAEILWVALDDPGHVLATYKPTRELLAHGHRVTFATFGDVAAGMLERRGFTCHRLFANELATNESRREFVDSWLKRPIRIRFRRERDRLITSLGEEVARVAAEVKPELIIVDSILSPGHLHVADKTGVPVALVVCGFHVPRRDRSAPPQTCDIVPGEPMWRARSATKWLSWWWYYDALRSYDQPNVFRVLRALRRERLDPRDGFVELLLTCHEFDYPHVKRSPEQIAIGPAIDLDRPKDPGFPWDKLANDRPLIYASLGTLGHMWAKEEHAMWRTILEAVRPHTDWQVVLAGKGLTAIAAELATAPPHVVAVEHAPQIDVLRRASVMVHHGGFNSVKECILLGVPMVALPPAGFADQPGVAARVVYHGIGRKGSMKGNTAEQVRAMIEDVLANPGYRERIGALKTVFERAEGEARLAHAIQAILAGKIGTGQPALETWRRRRDARAR